MERKLQVVEMMEQKGISVGEAAQAISFDPTILGLYLTRDAYPVPSRILDKLESMLAN